MTNSWKPVEVHGGSAATIPATVIYLSGPMTGLPEHNFPLFNAEAARLRAKGYTVINPAENFGGDTTLSHAEYMQVDIPLVAGADMIALLPGWEDSVGAAGEIINGLLMDKRIVWHETLQEFATREHLFETAMERLKQHFLREKTDESILAEADRIVHGARRDAYGHPYDNFLRTARLWEPIFERDVTPQMVALAMIQVKVARQLHVPKRDNLVDIAGYAGTYDMVEQRAMEVYGEMARSVREAEAS